MKPDFVWDAELLNRIANEPYNQQALGYEHIDLSGFYNRPGNIAIGTDQGVGLFSYFGHGKWMGHYLFSSGLSGVDTIGLARSIIDKVFTLEPASAILGQTPEGNKPARMLTRALGFAPVGTSTTASGRSCVNYKLERSHWAALSAESSVV